MLLLFEARVGGFMAMLAEKLSYAKLGIADSINHCSVAVVLQVKDVAGSVAALLHNASLHHHLHLVLVGELSHLIITTRCCSAHFWREET